jgi:predicted RNA-binding Zn-ribbon protein involved in translation (DUF1610 family)
MTETRSTIFHCPFCGDEDLWPAEGDRGWDCRSCLRVFTVTVIGLSRRGALL